jgi:hypothetical protein
MNDYIDLINLQNNLSNRMPSIIITSLTLTAGLAWNDAIQSVINYYIPEDRKKQMNIWMKLLYVICLTIVIIMIIGFLLKIEGEKVVVANAAALHSYT